MPTQRKRLPSVSEWAAQARTPTRVCETCRWIRRNPRAGGFLRDILAKIVSGEVDRPITDARRAVEAHGYAFSEAALQKHVRYCLR